MNRTKVVFLFIVFLLNTFCSLAQINYVDKLESYEQFLQLEGKPLADKYSGTQAVKVVLDIRRQKLYFLSAKLYRYHREFCTSVLGNNDELTRFNFTNYRSGYAREFVFATINYYPEKEIYTLEFSDIERYSNDVLLMFKWVRTNSYIGDKLLLHPRNDAQLNFVKTIDKTVPLVTANELYKGISKQMLVQGTAVGMLRKIDIDTLETSQINPWDIVLTNGSPNDIDLCAGLIITKFQSPLSHINILCHNRGTPVLAYKNAFEDESILQFINKPVRLEINDDYKLSASTQEELNQSKLGKRNVKSIKLNVDTKYVRLENIDKLDHDDVSRVGGKASNLGELYKIKRLSRTCELPEKAFAIPMAFYLEHLKSSGAEKMLQNLLVDSVALKDKRLLAQRLKQIKKKIKSHSIKKENLQLIQDKLLSLGYETGERIRFRSSTNAEDIKGFNGAGLYNSYTGIFGIATGKTTERAVKKVWASAWNDAAFRERQYFGIDQSSVAMAVLVHKAFGTEEVNGVVVSKNLYRKRDEAFVVNAQKGEVAIVAGEDSATAELSILSKNYADQTITNDYISYSSLNDEQALMDKRQLDDLFTAVQRIKYHYYYNIREENIRYEQYGLDIEFKIKNGQVIIKQVRSF